MSVQAGKALPTKPASFVASTSPGTRGLLHFAAAAAFAALLIVIVASTGWQTAWSQAVAAATIVVLALHCLAALGTFEALAFAAVCLIVTFLVENLGLATGIPFGRYVFNVGATLPHVGAAPLIVGPMYFGIGYPAWVIANILVNGGVERPRDLLRLVAVPVAAAFVIVRWDLVTDPVGSTLEGSWTWLQGGGYFGVPVSNFVGWWIETYVFFQLFGVLQYFRSSRPSSPPRSRTFWAVPILIYLAAGLCHLPPLF